MSAYNWRTTQRALNSFGQYTTRIEDFDIHFLHVRGKGPRPFPLILTHGWPGSIVEFLAAIGPLTDPASHGGAAADAFDVVIPSLPGFGFSSKPKGKPIGPVSIARMWRRLMTEKLGYSRYGAQGGDWGSIITIQLALQFPGDLAGIHLNGASVRPAPDAEIPEEERAWRRAVAAYRERETDYAGEQGNKPETVSFALADNPVGTAAWIVEKLKVWSDSGSNIESVFTKDDILSNVMIYLVTDSAPTAVWIYRGSREDLKGAPVRGKVGVPTGYAAFPREMTSLAPVRSALERDFNLTHYTQMPKGGHFRAALSSPSCSSPMCAISSARCEAKRTSDMKTSTGAFLLCVTGMLAASLMAQRTNGTISGTITDPAGAADTGSAGDGDGGRRERWRTAASDGAGFLRADEPCARRLSRYASRRRGFRPSCRRESCSRSIEP